MAEGISLGRTQSDINLTALTIEAERRRKLRGLIRYNYGDLIAEITPEERQRIIDDYRKKLGRKKNRSTGERFQEPDDKKDMRTIREKRGIPEEVQPFHPPQEEVRAHTGQGIDKRQAGDFPGLRKPRWERGVT